MKHVFSNIRTAKAKISLRTRAVWSDPSLSLYRIVDWDRTYYISQRTTKPTKYVRPAKTQISLGIHPVWSESSLSAWRKLGSLATHWAHNEDSDQTGRTPRLIWVFAGRTCIFVGFVMRLLIYLRYLIWICTVWFTLKKTFSRVAAQYKEIPVCIDSLLRLLTTIFCCLRSTNILTVSSRFLRVWDNWTSALRMRMSVCDLRRQNANWLHVSLLLRRS